MGREGEEPSVPNLWARMFVSRPADMGATWRRRNNRQIVDESRISRCQEREGEIFLFFRSKKTGIQEEAFSLLHHGSRSGMGGVSLTY